MLDHLGTPADLDHLDRLDHLIKVIKVIEMIGQMVADHLGPLPPPASS
jgi:hypothetical protein